MIRIRGALVLGIAFALGACSNDDDAGNAPATGLVLGEAIVQVGPVEQSATLGVGPRALQVTFPAGALPQRRPITVRATEPVTRGAVRPVGSTVQIASRAVSFVVPARVRQSVSPPAVGRRYAVFSADENAAVWVRRGLARVVGPSSGDSTDAGVDAGVTGSLLVVEGDIGGSGEWTLVEEDDVTTTTDAGVPDAGVAGDTASSRDTGFVGDGGILFAQISSIAPLRVTVGMPFMLSLTGANLPPGWVVFFDGKPVTTTIVSSSAAQAQVSEAATTTQGLASVWIGDPVDPASRTNALYLTIDPTAGAPVVIDYSPDNALPGATINIIGSNFASEPFTIRDSNGTEIPFTATGTNVWVGVSRETISFVLPQGTPSGPLTVSNSKGAYRGKIFTVGQNLSRIQDATATASSQYNTSNWSIVSGWDNKLQTSWFSMNGDCASLASCTTKPWFQISFSTPQTVARIAMRGNREYPSGYDFLEGSFEIFGPNNSVLWRTSVILPEPDRDVDLVLPFPVPNAFAVRFNSLRDESSEPGFSELQVFGTTTP